MKYLKMLGLAAVAAMALMAVVGAGTASADVICTENVNPCPAAKKITTIEASISAGTSATLTDTSGNVFATCTIGGVHADITAQAKGVNPSGPTTSITWAPKGEGCSTTVTTVAQGTLEVKTEGGKPVLWAKTAQVTLVAFGVSCTYGAGAGTALGAVTTGAGASVAINAVVNKTAGSFLCPSTARWVGKYTITNHSSAFVTEG